MWLSWLNMNRLTLGLELTRGVLLVKSLRRQSGAGHWPVQVSGLESSACPDGCWRHFVGSDGSMRITWVAAPVEGAGAWQLPLEYHQAA